MNDTTDRPTLGERYSTATESSNLKVKETACDADILIAAGWAHEQLGALLLRLQGEWDSAKAEMRGQGKDGLVDRVLALSKLTSLSATKEVMGRWACRLATRKRFMRPDADVCHIAGRALQLFLDPTCAHCQGRGKNGGYGMPEVLCKVCRGSGKKDHHGEKDEEARAFGKFLLCEMERQASAAEQSMRVLLRRGDGG